MAEKNWDEMSYDERMEVYMQSKKGFDALYDMLFADVRAIASEHQQRVKSKSKTRDK